MSMLHKQLLYYVVKEITTRKRSVNVQYRCNSPLFKKCLTHGWLNPQVQNPQVWRADCTQVSGYHVLILNFSIKFFFFHNKHELSLYWPKKIINAIVMVILSSSVGFSWPCSFILIVSDVQSRREAPEKVGSLLSLWASIMSAGPSQLVPKRISRDPVGFFLKDPYHGWDVPLVNCSPSLKTHVFLFLFFFDLFWMISFWFILLVSNFITHSSYWVAYAYWVKPEKSVFDGSFKKGK